jgi:hypothetical protein
MQLRNKIIVSIIGIGAVVVPAILLLTLTSSPPKQPNISSGERQIDPSNLEEAAQSALPTPSPIPSPSPTPTVSPEAEESTASSEVES